MFELQAETLMAMWIMWFFAPWSLGR